MKRTVLAVIAGLATWWVAFYASLAAFVLAWPALREATRPALASGDFSQITTPMWLLFLSMYLWVNPVSGWVATVIAKRHNAAWIVAALMGLYAAYMHYYSLWSVYPSWYNVLVPISIPSLVYVGARCAKSRDDLG
jgi:hypothetical protein